jgi:hypothetical protein
MTSHSLLVLIGMLGSLVLAGCTELDSDNSSSAATGPEQSRHSVTVVSRPDSGRIGSIIALSHSRFVPSQGYRILFPHAYGAVYVRCYTAGILTPFVPFGTVTGPISVALERERGMTATFTVTEPSDETRLLVKHYDITPPVTEEDSSIIDWLGHHCAWSAEVRLDTVHIRRRHGTGDEIYEDHFTFIDDNEGQLPRLLKAWRVAFPDYPETWSDTIRAGVMKIQDWDTSGVMSGRFFGKPWYPYYLVNGDIAFWIDKRR